MPEFQVEKRGRGRPKGSKNKPKTERSASPGARAPAKRSSGSKSPAAPPADNDDASTLVWTLTALCWLAYCAESLAASVVGPVLPDLAKRSGMEVAALTILIPAFNGGGAVGAAVGGKAFDAAAPAGGGGGVGRSAFILLAALQVGIAVANALTPASTDPMIMAGATFVHGAFNGAFRTGANWSMLRLHSPDTVAPYVQTMHFCSGAGRFMAGLVGAQFAGTEQLLWVFWVSSGLALAVGAALCLVGLSLGGTPVGVLSAAPNSGNKAAKSSASKAAAQDTTQFVGLLALFVFLLMGAQNSFQYLATSYAVSASPPLEFEDSSKAAMLSAGYGGAFAIGRLLSIPASARLTALTMMACSVAVAVAALAAVVAAPASSETLQVASASLGLALASLFPSALNYAKSTLGDSMTGGMLSILMLSGTFGGVVVPKIAGQLLGGEVFGFSGPEAMMQLLLVSTVGGAAVLVAAASSGPKTKTD